MPAMSVAPNTIEPQAVSLRITSFIRFEMIARWASTVLPISSRWLSTRSMTRRRWSYVSCSCSSAGVPLLAGLVVAADRDEPRRPEEHVDLGERRRERHGVHEARVELQRRTGSAALGLLERQGGEPVRGPHVGEVVLGAVHDVHP